MSSELERWGPRSKPKHGLCSRCHDKDTQEYLDTNGGLCRTCVGLDQLQERMITQGKMHPQLIPPNTAPVCKSCNGTGVVAHPLSTCPTCRGNGTHKVVERADRQLPPSDR